MDFHLSVPRYANMCTYPREPHPLEIVFATSDSLTHYKCVIQSMIVAQVRLVLEPESIMDTTEWVVSLISNDCLSCLARLFLLYSGTARILRQDFAAWTVNNIPHSKIILIVDFEFTFQ